VTTPVATTAPLFDLLLASHNRGKLVELRALLADLPVELVSLASALPGKPQAAEEGQTFVENARTKARAAAEATMMVTLAEDAGLEVDALGGRPGVRSARFAGEGVTDADNNAALLTALSEVEDDQRAARFRCVMVLLDPWAEGDAANAALATLAPTESSAAEVVAEGACEGRIARAPSGGGGFGYDPLFIVDALGRTMAELTDDEKNHVSHRARAVAALRPALLALIARREAAAARIAGPDSPAETR
jgi:XTP/dITP diphosphohydrolase